jgi:predicted RNase H-like HicB family nuclease
MSPNAVAQTEQNYSILIETPKTGGYRATALGLPNCRAKGATREIALQNVRELLTTRLSQSEIVTLKIVTLKIDSPQPKHPWMEFAGMFQNDPQFEEMQADIESYRQEVESQAGNK